MCLEIFRVPTYTGKRENEKSFPSPGKGREFKSFSKKSGNLRSEKVITDRKGRLCFQKRLSIICPRGGGSTQPLPPVVTSSGNHCSGLVLENKNYILHGKYKKSSFCTYTF